VGSKSKRIESSTVRSVPGARPHGRPARDLTACGAGISSGRGPQRRRRSRALGRRRSRCRPADTECVAWALRGGGATWLDSNIDGGPAQEPVRDRAPTGGFARCAARVAPRGVGRAMAPAPEFRGAGTGALTVIRRGKPRPDGTAGAFPILRPPPAPCLSTGPVLALRSLQGVNEALDRAGRGVQRI
jgi:hypothetical protein